MNGSDSSGSNPAKTVSVSSFSAPLDCSTAAMLKTEPTKNTGRKFVRLSSSVESTPTCGRNATSATPRPTSAGSV